MSADSVDDIHAAEDTAGTLAEAIRSALPTMVDFAIVGSEHVSPDSQSPSSRKPHVGRQ